MAESAWTIARKLFLEHSEAPSSSDLEAACGGDLSLVEAVRLELARLDSAERDVASCEAHLFGLPGDQVDHDKWYEGVEIDGYRIGERLGEGGFSEVFRAKEISTGHPVAIKALKPGSRDVLKREAESLRELGTIQGVVKVHRVGDDFIVLDFIEGETLDVWLQQPHSYLRRFKVIRRLCGILARIEKATAGYMVHCDLKPTNIMIKKEDEPELIDFGIATSQGHSSGARTTGYQVPEEVLKGETSSASDLFQIALVAFEMLTGQRYWNLSDQNRSSMLREVAFQNMKGSPGDNTTLASSVFGRGFNWCGNLCSGRLFTLRAIEEALNWNPERRMKSAATLGRRVRSPRCSWLFHSDQSGWVTRAMAVLLMVILAGLVATVLITRNEIQFRDQTISDLEAEVDHKDTSIPSDFDFDQNDEYQVKYSKESQEYEDAPTFKMGKNLITAWTGRRNSVQRWQSPDENGHETQQDLIRMFDEGIRSLQNHQRQRKFVLEITSMENWTGPDYRWLPGGSPVTIKIPGHESSISIPWGAYEERIPPAEFQWGMNDQAAEIEFKFWRDDDTEVVVVHSISTVELIKCIKNGNCTGAFPEGQQVDFHCGYIISCDLMDD